MLKVFIYFFLMIPTFSIAFAESETVDPKKLLHDLHLGTRNHPVPMKGLAQNFGGEAPKITTDRPGDYTQGALKLALADERVFQEVMRDVIFPLEKLFLNKSIDFSALAFPNARITLSAKGETSKTDLFWLTSWSSQKSAIPLKKASRAWIFPNATVRYAKLSPFSFQTSLSERNPETSLPLSFTLETRLDLRMTSNEDRIHDRGVLRLVVNRDQSSLKWKLSSMVFVNGYTLRSSGAPGFEEVSAFQKGELSNYLRKEAIRRGGYALAMGDINSDGAVDMIVGHMGDLEVFKGKADGSFLKVSNSELGIEKETLVKSIVIADFNNDNKKDLLLVRFAPSEEQGRDIVLYKNLGSKFQKSTSIKNRHPAYYAMPSAVADFDGNGMLDFYIGFPGAKDFTVLNKSNSGFEGVKDFMPQGLFYNQGEMNFVEVTREKLPYTKKKNAYTDGYPETALIFPHSSAGIDFDLDGDMDIVVIDDKANLSPLYKNDGKGSFSQVADKIGLTNYDFGMGFTAADLDNDGKLEFIYTNVNFLPSERLHNSLKLNFSEYSKHPGTFGLRIFKTKDNKNYSDISALTGIEGCGYGIGGVEVLDYDDDGYPDLYVTNGLWSGTHPEQDLSSLFVRANATYNYDFQELLGSGRGVETANTTFMKILAGFQGNVETQEVLDGVYPSMEGFQKNCLFRNNGDGTFTEVGFLEGVDSIADGYVLATADLNKDGKMDLVLRNGDPGTDANRFPAVQVFLNKKVLNNSVIISLRGTKSNRDGFGAILSAKIKGKTFLRHLVANNGAAQSESIIHFGLGQASEIDELMISWPSGAVQKFHHLKPGRFELVESMDQKITKK
jgi:hypothetical protein